ncbi:hypothetical protein L7F22_021008 [Adiantum nelumboides]|nr:hypothetical protein [Adiantum nelumboides]
MHHAGLLSQNAVHYPPFTCGVYSQHVGVAYDNSPVEGHFTQQMPRATQPHASLPATAFAGASPPLEDYVPSTQTIEEEPPSVQATAQDKMEAPAKRSRKGGRATQEKVTTKTKKAPAGRFHWDLRAQVIFLECKRQYDEKRSSSNLYQKIKTNEEQWVVVFLDATKFYNSKV